MKNILIITSPDNSTLSLIDICNDWREEFSIIAAADDAEATTLLNSEEFDLLITDLTKREDLEIGDLKKLTTTFPYIPFIAIIDPAAHTSDEILEIGVSSCLEAPINNEDLFRWSHELLDMANNGSVKGLPIHSLLQMIESEGKSCTLKVSNSEAAPPKTGLIFIEQGETIGAESDLLKGEEAVYEIISWENATAEIKFYNCSRKREIDKSLISLTMEGFRLKDERENLLKQKEEKEKKSKKIKHFSTAGKGLLLDNGLKMKLEITDKEPPLPCTLIGSVPEKYIIVTKPAGFDKLKVQTESSGRLMVKFLQTGRICMFKTGLLQAITSPDDLLFLDYPLVIHYHELRRAQRTSTLIPCTIQLPSGPKFTGVVLDISFRGCLCQIKSNRNRTLPNLELGSKVFIQSLFPGVKDEQELVGIVRNTKRNNTELRLGLELVDLPESIKEIISSHLDRLDNYLN